MSEANETSQYEVNPLEGVPPLSKSVEGLASALAGGGKDGTAFDPLESVMAGIRAGNAIIDILKVILAVAVRGAIAPAEMALRHRFGERYFNGWVSATTILIFGGLATSGLVKEVLPLSILAFFIVLLLLNRAHCFFRNRKGRYWHSYSEGDSFIRIGFVDRWLARRYFTIDFSKLFIEPLVLASAGFVLSCYWHEWMFLGFDFIRSNLISLYLYAAAILLFIYQLYSYFYRYNLLLNEKDARIMAEIRERLNSSNEDSGIKTRNGVTYAVLGPKGKWNR
jgi:hypothetical protein